MSDHQFKLSAVTAVSPAVRCSHCHRSNGELKGWVIARGYEEPPFTPVPLTDAFAYFLIGLAAIGFMKYGRQIWSSL